jgi:hypothetical protein
MTGGTAGGENHNTISSGATTVQCIINGQVGKTLIISDLPFWNSA